VNYVLTTIFDVPFFSEVLITKRKRLSCVKRSMQRSLRAVVRIIENHLQILAALIKRKRCIPFAYAAFSTFHLLEKVLAIYDRRERNKRTLCFLKLFENRTVKNRNGHRVF